MFGEEVPLSRYRGQVRQGRCAALRRALTPIRTLPSQHAAACGRGVMQCFEGAIEQGRCAAHAVKPGTGMRSCA